MTPAELGRFLIEEARALGFHRVGVVPIERPARYRAYQQWLASGYHGDMAYMAAPFHRAARRDLRELLGQARTLVVVALSYGRGTEPAAADAEPGGPRGAVARYARGADYHRVLRRKLFALAERAGDALGREVAARPCVDSAPVLERELAERAGLGFVGKNTMLIAPGLGSYAVLGELLLDVEAEAPPPETAGEPPRCGSCRACLDACPTGAFVSPYVLDARRCISYLTIEHRGPIPRELRPALGRMIFGCDICQDVCPFNARAPERNAPDPALAEAGIDRGAPELLSLLAMGANQRRRYVEGTALRRVNRAQLTRNVCVALGNAGDRRAIPALAEKLGDRSPLVRAHAAWALGRLGAAEPCREALDRESDPAVREELELAIADAEHPRRALPVLK